MMGRYAAEKAKGNPFAIFYTAEYRKFQTVVLGVLLSAATMGLLPAAVSVWVLLVIGVLVSAGVYTIPNKPVELFIQPASAKEEDAEVIIHTAEPVAELEPLTMERGDVKG